MYSSDSKKRKSTMENNTQQNIIASGTKFVGDIESKGAFRIDGIVEGSIKTEGKVVVGKSGSVNGTLQAVNVDVEGKFSGKLLLEGTLSLKSSAHIEGDVHVNKLAVEPGAIFNATCKMGNVNTSANTNNAEATKTKKA